MARRNVCQSPSRFRNAIVIDDRTGLSVAQQALPWQLQDFEQLDPVWSRLARRSDSPAEIRKAYIERPRGHSKTTDTAIQLAWILLASRRAVNGLVAAADFEQAQLVHTAIRRLSLMNSELLRDLDFVEHAVRNPSTGSQLKVVSSDVRSSWGELPDFVVCDELCHWKAPDLWYSLLSSAAKRPESVLMVLSNAGIGRGWQWDARESARTDPAWYFSSLDGPQAPWITEQSLAEQKRLLPPAVFARLWLNQWQHSDGEFVSL
ncbi:MAG TPA: terminase large subunit, partial [Caulifigura sp.]|nr:terminase large subunit [Caulifigura sp.]